MSDDLSILPIIEFRGNSREMGEQLGEQTRQETQQLYERRLRSAQKHAIDHAGRQLTEEKILELARRCLVITEEYDSVGYEEFAGIARGANLSPEKLFVTQGLTDLRDVMTFSDDVDAEGCSSFIVGAPITAKNQLLLGQNWDLQSNNLPYVRLIHRKPTDDFPETWSLTLTGCLTLIGLNSEGIAVGNTNLKTLDARIGTQYLSVLHRAIRSRSFEEATNAIANAPRSGAHYYYVADRNGNAVGLECSAAQVAPLKLQNDMLIHCNHALDSKIDALKADEPGSSTCARQKRVTQLTKKAAPNISVEDMKKVLSDHENGEDAICRHTDDPEGVATNACVIMSPQTGELHACRGHAHLGKWRDVSC